MIWSMTKLNSLYNTLNTMVFIYLVIQFLLFGPFSNVPKKRKVLKKKLFENGDFKKLHFSKSVVVDIDI